ncbi:hypothetical protein [Actinomadura chokoriensis]|uniref:hypothetical protein n=1 Tax=Actinomadura chokoriensis TaxID=454156 RepID=UPI0031F8ADCA
MSPREKITPTAAIARQVSALRSARGLTAKELGERMTARGCKWDRFTVSALEKGAKGEKGARQNVTVAELLALADALDVPPVTLLVPLDGRTDLEVAPNVARSSYSALFWVTGENAPADAERRARWLEAAGPVDTYRTFRDTFRAAAKAETREDVAGRDAHLRTLAQVIELGMLNRAITPPALPAEWLDVMRDRGWLERADEVPVQAEDG